MFAADCSAQKAERSSGNSAAGDSMIRKMQRQQGQARSHKRRPGVAHRHVIGCLFFSFLFVIITFLKREKIKDPPVNKLEFPHQIRAI